MMVAPRFVVIIILCALFCAPASASPPDGISVAELFPGAQFDPAVPTQAELLGVEPGSRPLRHAELMRYLEALADSSPRAVMRNYSATHEGRRMVVRTA